MNGCSCPLAPNLILPVRLCQSAKWGGEAKQRDGGRGARVWKKSKRERERWCVKGLHKSEPKDLIANVRPETQSLFRWYPTVSNTHTCTHTRVAHPSPEATNFECTALCCCCVCSAVRAGAADCWKQHAVKANTVQGGGQPVDWWGFSGSHRVRRSGVNM